METKLKEVPSFLEFCVVINSSVSLDYIRHAYFANYKFLRKFVYVKHVTCERIYKNLFWNFIYYCKFRRMSLQKKLYKERKSLWIYQIFKSFETCFSLSNVFVRSRYYKNPIEFIFNSVSSN